MITDQTIIAAADIEWEEDFSEFPASEYDSDIYLKLGSAAAVKVTTTKEGDTFVRTIPNTLLTAGGNYQYQYQFTNLEDSKVSAPVEYSGVIEVKSNLAASGDLRSDEQKVLEELEAARLRVAAREYVSITINGKATQFKTLTEIDQKILEYKKRLGIYKQPRLINSF